MCIRASVQACACANLEGRERVYVQTCMCAFVPVVFVDVFDVVAVVFAVVSVVVVVIVAVGSVVVVVVVAVVSVISVVVVATIVVGFLLPFYDFHRCSSIFMDSQRYSYIFIDFH